MASKNIDEITEAGVRRSERKTKVTPKALQKAIQDIQTEIVKSRRRLLIIMQSVKENSDGSDIKTIASERPHGLRGRVWKPFTKPTKPV